MYNFISAIFMIVIFAAAAISLEFLQFRIGKGIPGAKKFGLTRSWWWNWLYIRDEIQVLRENRVTPQAETLLHGYYKRLRLIGFVVFLVILLLGILEMIE